MYKILIAFFALTIFIFPNLTFAQLPTPTSPFLGPPVTLTDIQGIIETIARFLIIISVLIAVIAIVTGGIKLMNAGDDPRKASGAKSTIVHGLIGAAFVLAVGLILQTLATVVNWTVFFNV